MLQIKPFSIFFISIFFIFIACGPSHDSSIDSEGVAFSPLPGSKLSINKTFQKEQYLSDLFQLADSIQKKHPNPFEFSSKQAFQNQIVDYETSITDATTIGDFVRMCHGLIASVGCGHSNIGIESRIQLPASRFFPMEAKYIDSKLIVLDPLSNVNIPVGTEILAINGKEITDLKNDIQKIISADGYNQSFLDHYTSKYFNYHSALQLGFPNEYKVLVHIDNSTKEITLIPTDTSKSKKTPISTCQSNLCFEIDSLNNLGIITIKSFVYYNENLPEFKAFIDDCFLKVKQNNLSNLVIDLRDNGGGDPYCGSYLLQHISDKPFQYYKTDEQNSYKDLQSTLPFNENRFKGQPYILVNGACFSTTGHVSSLIRYLGAGHFVGQETGATFSCNAHSIQFELANTGLPIYLATQVYQTAVTGFSKDKGISPDYPIHYSLSDHLAGKDLELEKVMELINKE